MKRPVYGFWQRFVNIHGQQHGPWMLVLLQRRKLAELLHKTSRRYAVNGPIFTTHADIPQRNKP